MKKIKILGLIFTLIIVIFSCDKLADPAGPRGTAVVPAISNVAPGIFDSKNLVSSFVQFKVDLASGQQADNGIVVGSYKTNGERIKIADITSFPATVTLVSGDVIRALGISAASVKNGDVFTLEVLTTVNGVATRSNAALRIPVACGYDKTLTIGSYHSLSVTSEWNSEGNVTITPDASDPYTVYVAGLEALEGFNEDLGPLPMHINPATYAVTVEPTIIVSAGDYGTIKYGGNGTYNSCDGSYAMNFDITLGAYGPQGKFKFTLTRN